MTQTNKASAFETFYSFMSKETYDVFVQYIIEVWQSKLHVSSGSWNDWHPQVTNDLETPVYAVPDGDKLYNVYASRFRVQVTTDAFGLMVTLCALHGVLLDFKDNRLPMISDTEGKQIQDAFDDLLRYARTHAEANAITPEFGSDNSSYRDLATESVDDLLHQRALFANAIGEGAVKLGIIAEGTPLTMPQLLMVLGDIIEYASRNLNKNSHAG
ncbi:antirestriction protein [Pectobacterium aroidearum]|uniref:antirestriction protein n=1 Tax=Pectobacterium aroidearum TaxID=1201031 RepID=UPI0032EE0BBE